MVANETNAATQHKQAVERANLDVLVSFFAGEGPAIAKQVDKADGNAAVDVENQLGDHVSH